MKKQRIYIDGMHCSSCSLLIEGELADIGVDATCYFAEGCVDVAFDEKEVPAQAISDVITRLGYRIRNK